MGAQELLARITVEPGLFGGRPTLRGPRISVELVLGLLARQESQEAILAGYPALEPDDIRACLVYALAVIPHATPSSAYAPA